MYLHRKDTATGGFNKVTRGFDLAGGPQDVSIVKGPDAIWRLVIEEVVLNNGIREKNAKKIKLKQKQQKIGLRCHISIVASLPVRARFWKCKFPSSRPLDGQQVFW
jgi:hypothetical protein